MLLSPQHCQEVRVLSAPSTRSRESGGGGVSPPTAAPQPPAVQCLNQEQTQRWQDKSQLQRALFLFSPEISSAVCLYNLHLISWCCRRNLEAGDWGAAAWDQLVHPLSWSDQPVLCQAKSITPSSLAFRLCAHPTASAHGMGTWAACWSARTLSILLLALTSQLDQDLDRPKTRTK